MTLLPLLLAVVFLSTGRSACSSISYPNISEVCKVLDSQAGVFRGARGMGWIRAPLKIPAWEASEVWAKIKIFCDHIIEGRWIRLCKSTDPSWLINHIHSKNFALDPKSGQTYLYYTQNPKSRPKKCMNLQSAVTAGSGNLLKSCFESKIQAKIISKGSSPIQPLH